MTKCFRFALQFAVASGATVIATSSDDEKLKIAAKLGAKHLINYKKTPNWDQEVLKFTNGLGVDRVLEVQ
jgi:NADPH:quinone reductase-like Zn-dependent oxidoreductase